MGWGELRTELQRKRPDVRRVRRVLAENDLQPPFPAALRPSIYRVLLATSAVGTVASDAQEVRLDLPNQEEIHGVCEAALERVLPALPLLQSKRERAVDLVERCFTLHCKRKGHDVPTDKVHVLVHVFGVVWSGLTAPAPVDDDEEEEEDDNEERAAAAPPATEETLVAFEVCDSAYPLFRALEAVAGEDGVGSRAEHARALFGLLLQYHLPDVVVSFAPEHPLPHTRSLLGKRVLDTVASMLSKQVESDGVCLVWDHVALAPSPLSLACHALAAVALAHKHSQGLMEAPVSASTHPSYPPRLPVPAGQRHWSDAWRDYKPPEFTHHSVLENDVRIKEGGWADPLIVPSAELRRRFSHTGCVAVSAAGPGQPCPLNPHGRTGVRGRGVLGLWGPNHCAVPIITREHDATTQVLCSTSKGTDLPSASCQPKDRISQQLCFELQQHLSLEGDAKLQARTDLEALLKSGGKLVFAGYEDDNRNTDNAWVESLTVHFALPPPLAAALHNLPEGLEWMAVDDALQAIPPHHQTRLKKALRDDEAANEDALPASLAPEVLRTASLLQCMPPSFQDTLTALLAPEQEWQPPLCVLDIPCIPMTLGEGLGNDWHRMSAEHEGAGLWQNLSTCVMVDVRGTLGKKESRLGVHIDPVEMPEREVDLLLEQVASARSEHVAIVCAADPQSQQYDVGDLARARAVLGALHKAGVARVGVVLATGAATPSSPLGPRPRAGSGQKGSHHQARKGLGAGIAGFKALWEGGKDKEGGEKERSKLPAFPLPPVEGAAVQQMMRQKVSLASNLFKQETSKLKDKLHHLVEGDDPNSLKSSHCTGPSLPQPAYEVVEFGDTVVSVRDEVVVSELMNEDTEAEIRSVELFRPNGHPVARYLIIGSRALVRLMPHKEKLDVGIVESCYPLIALRRLLLNTDKGVLKFEFAADTDPDGGKERKVGFAVRVDEAAKIAKLIQRQLAAERKRVLQDEQNDGSEGAEPGPVAPKEGGLDVSAELDSLLGPGQLEVDMGDLDDPDDEISKFLEAHGLSHE